MGPSLAISTHPTTSPRDAQEQIHDSQSNQNDQQNLNSTGADRCAPTRSENGYQRRYCEEYDF